MFQICDHFPSLLFSVETWASRRQDLYIYLMTWTMIDERWLRLIRTFRGAKNFRVASELATDILRALCLADEGHEVVLPTLRNLHV